MESAKIGVDELDLIVVATTTPNETFPSVATAVQARLGMMRGAAFDVQAVCSGFIYGLAVADNFIKARAGEDHSSHRRRNDVASAWIGPIAPPACCSATALARWFYGQARGDGYDIRPWRAQHQASTRMGGCTTCSMSMVVLPPPVRPAICGCWARKCSSTPLSTSPTPSSCGGGGGVSVSDIDWFVPHQANQRILDATARRLKVPAERFISTIAEHGNTSAASVPLALDVAVADGRIKRGDLVLLEAMGGGLTWGAGLLRW